MIFLAYSIPAAMALFLPAFMPLWLGSLDRAGIILIIICLFIITSVIAVIVSKLLHPSIQQKILKQRRNFELLVSTIEDYAIFLLDTKGLVVSWNNGAERMKGFTAADITGKPTDLFYTAADITAGLPQGNLQKAHRRGHMQAEGWRVRKDGSLFFADVAITALFDGKFQHYGYAVVTKDISGRKNAEVNLLSLNTDLSQSVLAKTKGIIESETKYRYLFENNPVPMYVVALSDFSILDVNERALAQYGYTKIEFLNMTSVDMQVNNDHGLFTQPDLSTPVFKGKYSPYTVQHYRKDGTIITVEIISNVITFEGKPASLVYANDVTEQLASEEKLVTGEAQFRNTLDNMLEGIQIHDYDWRYVYVNQALVAHSQYSRAELLGHTLMEKYPGIATTDLFTTMQRCMNERIALQFETEFTFPDGVIKHFQLSIEPVPEGIFILSIDISDRKKAIDKLLESQHNYRNIMERVSDGFAAIDKNWCYSYVNKKGAAILRQTPEALMSRNVWATFPETVSKPFHLACYTAMEQQHDIHLDEYYAPFDLWLETHIYPSPEGLSVFFRDITARKKADQQREFDQSNLFALINNTGDLLWSVALDYTLITCNQAFEKMFKRLSGSNVRHGDTLLNTGFSPDRLKIFKALYQRAFAGESFTTEHSGFDGDSWSEFSFHPVLDGEMVMGTACFGHDITERKIAEGLLENRLKEKRAVATRMTAILNTIPASIALLDHRGVVIDVNNTWRSGTKHNGFTGNAYQVQDNYLDRSKHFLDENHEAKQEVVRGLEDVLSHKVTEFVHEYDCDEPGVKTYFRMVVRPLLGKEGAGAVVMHIDITELRRLEREKLASKIEQQKSIARAMLQAQEKERNHIGLELHDNVSQLLAAIRMKLHTAISGNGINLAMIKECIVHVEETAVETRNLSHRMVMPRFADSSFVDAIEQLAIVFRTPSRKLQLNTAGLDESIVSPGIKETLYRILQEQLNNINKYAQATCVSIEATSNKETVTMMVEDNGIGFNTTKKKDGIGLVNIRNRSESYNGTSVIVSSPGKGCKLTIDIPLATEHRLAYAYG